MKKIIIVTGALATGKSTYSNILSKRYNIPVLNKDDIKEKLSDIFGFSNREENLKLSHATYEVMKYSLNKTIESNSSIILEANFHTEEVEELVKILDSSSYDYIFLVLSADIDILYDRYIKRSKENRHPCHLSGIKSYDEFKNYIEINNEIEYPTNNIRINANDFSFEKNATLFKMIDSFINKE